MMELYGICCSALFYHDTPYAALFTDNKQRVNACLSAFTILSYNGILVAAQTKDYQFPLSET